MGLMGADNKKPIKWDWDTNLVSPQAENLLRHATRLLPFWGQGAPYDLITDTFMTVSGSPTRATGTQGIVADCDAISDYWDLGLVSEVVPTLDKISILVVRRKTDATLRNSSLFGSTLTGGERVQTHCPFTDGTVYWDHAGQSGGDRITAAGLSFSGVEAWIFSAGPSGHRLVRNGILLASNTTAASDLDAALLTEQFGLNQRLGTATRAGDLLEMGLFASIDMDMPVSTARQITRDPFMLIRQDPSKFSNFFVPVAVGGRIMSSLAGSGGLAGMGGIAGPGGGLAA